MRVAILTISDSSFRGEREDLSGPALAQACEASGWQVVIREVLPDERAMIASRLRELADASTADLILTTGGTGIAARDVTPEAAGDVIEKSLPGLGELMRAEGLKYTRRAVLSRSAAGTRGASLIVTLPGSPKGARQSLDAILDLIPHIIDLLRGQTVHRDEPPKR